MRMGKHCAIVEYFIYKAEIVPKSRGKSSASPKKKFISLNEMAVSFNEMMISFNEMMISFNEMNFL